RHTISKRDWSSDVCSSDLYYLSRPLPSLYQSCHYIKPKCSQVHAPLISFSADNMNRCPMEIKCAAQLIFQIPFIAEVHQLGIIDEHDECRRPYTDLRTVKDIQTMSAFIGRRRVHAYAVDDHFIECA